MRALLVKRRGLLKRAQRQGQLLAMEQLQLQHLSWMGGQQHKHHWRLAVS